MARDAAAAALLWLFCAAAFAQTEPEARFWCINPSTATWNCATSTMEDYLRDKQLQSDDA